MTWETAYEEAIRIAVEKLREVDIANRCRALSLPEPQGGSMHLRAFGVDMVLLLSDFRLFKAATGEPVKPGDRILMLHYLLCDLPLEEVGELISFRGLAGGQFYWEPFCSRTVRPLVKKIGNNLERLSANLDRFDWKPVTLGDLGARIHAIGKLFCTLVYRLGDEEFPASADFLFDSSFKRVYNAEDTAVLAGCICHLLMR
jgi:hypothetical protein